MCNKDDTEKESTVALRPLSVSRLSGEFICFLHSHNYGISKSFASKIILEKNTCIASGELTAFLRLIVSS